jgi:endogenous inhibitor of DNA gyrase (YacG/DUF329 family)
MIRIYEKPKVIVTLNCGKEYEYSCPGCFKPIKWNVVGALSPFYCPGCRQKQLDVSRLISKIEVRADYHLEGEKAVSCGGSALI